MDEAKKMLQDAVNTLEKSPTASSEYCKVCYIHVRVHVCTQCIWVSEWMSERLSNMCCVAMWVCGSVNVCHCAIVLWANRNSVKLYSNRIKITPFYRSCGWVLILPLQCTGSTGRSQEKLDRHEITWGFQAVWTAIHAQQVMTLCVYTWG